MTGGGDLYITAATPLHGTGVTIHTTTIIIHLAHTDAIVDTYMTTVGEDLSQSMTGTHTEPPAQYGTVGGVR